MTACGMVAPLSPKEEGALRRIAGGVTMIDFLPARELERLQHLDLATVQGNRVYLTESGRKRAHQGSASKPTSVADAGRQSAG